MRNQICHESNQISFTFDRSFKIYIKTREHLEQLSITADFQRIKRCSECASNPLKNLMIPLSKMKDSYLSFTHNFFAK